MLIGLYLNEIKGRYIIPPFSRTILGGDPSYGLNYLGSNIVHENKYKDNLIANELQYSDGAMARGKISKYTS